MPILARISFRLTVALLCLATTARGQTYTYKSHIEHPIVKYKMSARLDPKTKIVNGHYTLTWWNHTEDTIPDLYFHLYLNAFKNVDSTFMRESRIRRRGGNSEWLDRPEAEKWGWVDVDKVQIVGGTDLTAAQTFVHPDDDNAADQSVMRIVLPRPIPPHGTIDLAVDFTSKLPHALARSGFEGDYFLMAQWFPKIGVYEAAGERGRTAGGWNCHQYHANTEFYADYGVYDVELTAPSNFLVGATGVRRQEHNNPDGTTTYNYFQEDVHDFAWTASPRFVKVTRPFVWRDQVKPEEIDTWSKILDLPPAQIELRDVTVTFLLQPGHTNVADRYFRALFNGLKFFGLWYGQYPYDTMTVVDVPRNSATCCMEYPTFITVGTNFWPGKHALSPEAVTVHEFGHQFWYGLVGNNEFEEALLDEGFNTYSTGKVLETAFGAGCNYERFLNIPIAAMPWFDIDVPALGPIPLGSYFSCIPEPQRTAGRDFYLEHAKDDNLVRNGWEYLSGASYGLNSYTRTALTLRMLESYLGAETMARVMRTYQQRWRYRHPSTPDFIAVVNEVSGTNMDWFFQQFFYSSNLADYAVTEIDSSPIEGKSGIYGGPGKKTTYSQKDSEEAFNRNTDKRWRSTVLVQRLGEAVAPVDVDIYFENGEFVREHWNGQYRWIRYVYERNSKVASAEADPERKLVLDSNYTNNSYVVKQDNRAAARWYVRWIFWLENLFFAASFLS